MFDEQKIAREQGRTLVVEHGQVIVGMSGRPCPQRQYPLAEIEFHFAVDQQRGRHDLDVGDQRIAKNAAKCAEIIIAARGQRARQILVPDENRSLWYKRISLLYKRRVAKNVIGVNMGIDHVANGLRRYVADGGKQSLAFAGAAAGVDHGHRVVADDEAEIGGIALVRLAHDSDIADMDVDTRRNFGDRQRRLGGLLFGRTIAAAQDDDRHRREQAACIAQRFRAAAISFGRYCRSLTDHRSGVRSRVAAEISSTLPIITGPWQERYPAKIRRVSLWRKPASLSDKRSIPGLDNSRGGIR